MSLCGDATTTPKGLRLTKGEGGEILPLSFNPKGRTERGKKSNDIKQKKGTVRTCSPNYITADKRMNDPTKVVFQSNCANVPNGYLDTLAQLRKRARSKYAQLPILLALVDSATKSGDYTMAESYWNSYHCASRLEQDGQKLTGKYCNNRWCLVCSRIRTGKLINKYEPYFKTLHEPQFVTLTAPTVIEVELSERLYEMGKQFRQIKDNLRKMGTPLIGVRKLEVEFNPNTNKYHPHYHLIIEGKYEAECLVNLWLKKNPTAKLEAQNIQDADVNSLLELFKYTAKLCSKDRRTMNAYALNVIFRELRGMRTFQSIGEFGQGETENDDEINPRQVSTYNELTETNQFWQWDKYDWKNNKGENLSGYEPSEAIEQFRNNLEQCNANNVEGNSPQRTSNTNIALTSVDKAHFIPVKPPYKRPYKRPPQRATQTTMKV